MTTTHSIGNIADASTMSARIFTWLDALTADYTSRSPGHIGVRFECDAPRKGQKYVRVIQCDFEGRARSVHAFYDIRTGDVYKPASWKAPAKIVRFNLLDDESFATMIETCDWAGGYLYLK